jgi:hypothetical protein
MEKPPVYKRPKKPLWTFNSVRATGGSMVNYPHLRLVPASAQKEGTHPEDPGEALALTIQEALRKFQEIAMHMLSSGIPSDPGALMELEKRLHQEIARECIDPVVCRFVILALDSPEVAGKAKEIIANTPFIRLQSSHETVRITLLGGSRLNVISPYYLVRPPKGRGRPRRKGSRGKGGKGIYPFLDVLGIHSRVTPALAGEVGRLVALEPFEEAVSSLRHRGIHLGQKTVSRIANRIARRGIEYRERLKVATCKGYCGHEVEGKRLVISTDGGRIRTRVSRKRGRLRKSGAHGFDAPWREPKVITIYEIDDRGHKKKSGVVRYDVTMGNADETFSLIETYLISIGAQYAKDWTFICDGACWIWDRVPALVESVGYDMSKVAQIVDFYHAVEHLNKISDEINGWKRKKRKRWFNAMRAILKKGEVMRLIEECAPLCRGRNARKIRRELQYFEKNEKRMNYSLFREEARPIGSGAVESCVRRVVNLRFKGNGIFWKEETAEGLLHLRAQLLSGRWDTYISSLLEPKNSWFNEKPSNQVWREAA